MFVSDNRNDKVSYSQATLNFIEDYDYYESKLITSSEYNHSIKGTLSAIVNYLENYRISFTLFLGASGFFMLTNHVNSVIGLIIVYSLYHYISKMLKRKEKLKELELNSVRRSIFFQENFLKNKNNLLSDLFKGEDDLGLFNYYKKKQQENKITESDMESIVCLLKAEINKQESLEKIELNNFIRKINDWVLMWSKLQFL